MPSNFRLFLSPMQRHAEMLGSNHFAVAVAAAVALHMLALFIYHISPKTQVIDIPVRALNIKLSEDDLLTEEEIKLATPTNSNYSQVENTITRLVRSQEAEAAREKSVVKSIDKAFDNVVKIPTDKKLYKFDMRSEGVKSAAPVMPVVARQFVRDLAAPTPVAKPEQAPLSNSASKEAEVLARYEQLISMWIQKFKQYPNAAKSAGMQGETVVRIRIDRRGNVKYYSLERSTGHADLDRAAVDMIRRANPVPAAPADYPTGGEVLEFLIPVNFQLQ
ncbi:MAG: energy transducer TonB [Alphaproteobacteria bacterium]